MRRLAGFPGTRECASLENAQGNHCYRQPLRPRPLGSGSGQSQQPAEARLALPDRLADRQWPGDSGDHATDRQEQVRGLALAGALYAGWGRRRLKRGVFRSLVELQAAINRFIAETNHEPTPFVWTADPDKIIAAIESRAPSVRLDPLEHDPEKWVPIFGQDHAPKLGRGRMARPRPIGARSDNRI